MDRSSLLLLLICVLSLQQWSLTIWTPCTAVSGLIACTTWKTVVFSRIQYFGTIPFVSSYFLSYFGQQHLSPLPSGRLYHTFVIQLDFLVMVCSLCWILLNPPPQLIFFKTSYIKGHSLWTFMLKFYAFWQVGSGMSTTSVSLSIVSQHNVLSIWPFPLPKPLATIDCIFQELMGIDLFSR